MSETKLKDNPSELTLTSKNSLSKIITFNQTEKKKLFKIIENKISKLLKNDEDLKVSWKNKLAQESQKLKEKMEQGIDVDDENLDNLVYKQKKVSLPIQKLEKVRQERLAAIEERKQNKRDNEQKRRNSILQKNSIAGIKTEQDKFEKFKKNVMKKRGSLMAFT